MINKNLIDLITQKFKHRFGHNPGGIARAPGRVNLLGEHVDYNEGIVMPAAIDRATYAAFSNSEGSTSTLVASDFEQEISFTCDSILQKQQRDSSPLPEWGLYPAGVAKTLLEQHFPVSSVNVVFASDIPRGAGLSSSASVEVAFITLWQSLAGVWLPLMDRAAICQEAEDQYVGVHCGIMDQFASVCGEAGRILQLDCRSLEWNRMQLSENTSIVIADTMNRRKLNSSEYNQRRGDCDEAVDIIKQHLPEIRSLRDLSLITFNQFARHLPSRVEKRARHVVEEIERTRKAWDYLSEMDLPRFGSLMNDCHVSLRDLYEVSSFELEAMVQAAQKMDGCYGARLTGAGFGGCTVNLVETVVVERFIASLKRSYLEKTGINADIFVTSASAGAGLIN